MLASDWRDEFNDSRPHSALGMLTPTAFAAKQRTEQHPNSGWISNRASGKIHPCAPRPDLHRYCNWRAQQATQQENAATASNHDASPRYLAG